MRLLKMDDLRPKKGKYLRKRSFFVDRERVLYFVLMYIVSVFFFCLVVDRYVAPTGLWSTYAWVQMKEGKVIYRDFYYYLPPLAVVMDGLMQELANFDMLLYRFYHLILIRMSIISIFYWLLTKYYPPENVWIACVTALILYASSPYDGMGDYNQNRVLLNAILIAVSTGFCELPLNKRPGQKGQLRLFACGFLMGLILLIKQSSGVFTAFIYFCFLVFYCVIQKDKNFIRYAVATLCGFAVPIGVAVVWLASEQALVPMIEQLFLKMDAKGDVNNVLLGGLTKTFKNYEAISVFSLFAVAAMLMKRNTPAQKYASTIRYVLAGIFTLSAVGLFLHYTKDLFVSTIEAMALSNYLFLVGGFVLIISICMGAFAWVRSHKPGKLSERKNERILTNILLAALLLVGSAYAFTLSEEVLLYLNNGRSFYLMRNSWPYISFFTLVLTILVYAWKWGFATRKEKSEKAVNNGALEVLCILVGFFAVVIEGAITSTTGLSQATMLTTFLVVLLLALNVDFKKANKVKYIAICTLCFVCIYVYGAKNICPLYMVRSYI